MPDQDRTLTERRAEILRAIVSHYVGSGEPVGSKTIVDRFEIDASSATVRHEMSALEDAGYIYQPHTSAGRVPTDAGYRYFVDAWASNRRLPAAESRRVQRFFGEPRWELEEALRQTASLLSRLTDHAAVVFAPALERSLIRHVELVGLAEGRAMLVVVTDTGRVENHVVGISEAMDDVQLGEAAAMLTKLVVGRPLEQAPGIVEANLGRLPLELKATIAAAAGVLSDAISTGEAKRLFLDGTSTIVDEAKFSDLETVRQVVSALEHRRLLLEVLAEALSVGSVSVRIGSENELEEMQVCTVITAPYGTGEASVGSLGIVGPTRMDYQRTIPAVYEVATYLGRMLSGFGT
jgi:heat-inducible transcriptional repressor